MSIITISSIFNDDYNDYEDFCNNGVVANFIDTTTFETTLATYVYSPIWLRYKDTPIKFSNDDKGKDAFLRNFYNQLSEVVFDFHNYAKENIEYFLYQNDVTKQGKPMSKTITSGIAPINQKIDQALDSTNLASGTGSQFVSETVYNGVAWHKLVEGYFTPNRKTALLKAFQWLFISVYSPETKYDDKIEQVRYVELSFVDEDNNIIDEQKVLPSKSYYTMSEVNIQRPLMLDPQNIAKDVEIAGIVGTFIGNTISNVTVQSDLTQDQIINTPVGYTGMEQVTVEKPLTALPENIKDGVNIGGVTGTYTGVDELEQRITNDNDPYSYENNNITVLRGYAFAYDTNITSFSSTSLTTIYTNGNQFTNCSNIKTINIPNVTSSIPSFTFSNCNLLETITAPLITGSIGQNAFYFCKELKSVYFPNLSGSISGSYAFGTCNKLETAHLGNATSIATYSFNACTSLTDLYLTKSNSICTLANVNAFNSTTQLITVHVPSNLIATYQTASNWSTLYNNNRVTFVAL